MSHPHSDALAPGIEGSFEPVDWHPAGLPEDPDEIVAWILDPKKRGELYPLYHQLRRKAPVHRNRPDVMHGGWTFARFSDTDALFRDASVVNDPAVVDEAFSHGDGTFKRVMQTVMLWRKPEDHARLRNLVRAAFTPRAIARFRPIAEKVANALCDGIEGDGGADLVDRYNYELPFNVIAHILGIPESDFAILRQHAWNFARGAERVLSDEAARRADEAAAALTRYFTELAEARRSAPTDDLLSSLIAAEAEGQRLSQEELVANAILLLQAGHETTQDLIGNAQVALFRHPDQLALLRDRPELTASAVEECLRYDGSVQVNHRIVIDETRVAGRTIPAGSMVYFFLGAANRDPERFPEPDRLDIRRSIPHHLAFSFGAYYCLGASLARTEAQVGLRTLLDRFPGLRPATGTFAWRDTLLLRGPLRLEVVW